MLKNTSLKRWNTFGVDVRSQYSTVLKNKAQLKELLAVVKQMPAFYILGDGANILFTKDVEGLVIKNRLRGIELIEESDTNVIIRVASGEDWHEFVTHCVSNNWSGIENLAYIPGTVGAAVAQNIAAYGHNIEDCVVTVEGVNIASETPFQMTSKQCVFSYRNSIFKQEESRNLLITQVTFKISKIFVPTVDYYERYSSLETELGKSPESSMEVFNAIIRLRKRKLPDWTKTGTAGSFFKNPIVTKGKYQQLKKDVKELQAYPVEKLVYTSTINEHHEKAVKIPAARLLDELGWRGKTIGRVGTFEKQALVVINLGNAAGMEILEFTEKMKEDIYNHFEILLEPEVKIY